MTDRVEEVRLPEAGPAVDEERVVRLCRRLCDGDRRRVGETVGGADDERLENVVSVETRRFERLGRGARSRGVEHLGVRDPLGRRRRSLDRFVDRRAGEGLLGLLVGERGVDGDDEARVAPEGVRERVGELRPDPVLEVLPGPLVGDGDDDRALGDGEGCAELDEGDLPRGHVGARLELRDRPGPDLGDVDVCCRHRSPSLGGRTASVARPSMST